MNPENNLNYEYGAYNHGNQSGRLTKQEDVNGVRQFTYDELGNIKTITQTMIVSVGRSVPTSLLTPASCRK